MKNYNRQTAVITGLAVLLAGTAIMFSSCAGQTVENSAVSETNQGSEKAEEQTEKLQIETADIKEPFEAEGMNFSVKSGSYDSPFYLEITAPEGITVYYTLDGSEPDTESIKYTEPVLITDRSDEPAVMSRHTDIVPPMDKDFYAEPDVQKEKATVLRAMAVDKNGIQTGIVTNTYFIGNAIGAEKYKGLKIISLVTAEGNLFDHEKGIYVMGKTYDDWKKSSDYDRDTFEWDIPANYRQKGRDWERPVSIQFFEDGKLVCSEDAGIRIHGGASRSYPQKSFNVYFRKDYGSSKLEYDLFSGSVKTKSGGETVNKFDSFMLRNGGNDAEYLRFRDSLIQSLVSHRDFLTQGMEPCIVYINGEFWGQYEITEKMDNSYISTHYGVPKNEVCMIKKDMLEEGSEETFAEFEELKAWVGKTDFSDQSAYEELCRRVDMKSYMEYISTEIYIDNSDWGSANSALWKAEKTDESNPYADGKWRFILFDTEYSTSIYPDQTYASKNSFKTLLESKGFIGRLFDSALKNDTFRKEFEKTFMDIAENDFSDERVNAAVEKYENEYRDIAADTIYRFWGCQSGMLPYYHYAADNQSPGDVRSNYDEAMEMLKRFFSRRRGQITKHLQKYVN